MNENELNNNSSSRETYRATTNLNIDMENPQINMDSVVGINIKDGYPNYPANDNFSTMGHESFTTFDPNLGSSSLSDIQNNPQNIENNFQSDYYHNANSNVGIDSNFSVQENQFVPTMDSNISSSESGTFQNTSVEKPVYEPVLEEKKQKGQTLSASKELRITIFIIFILFIFILLMPYVYDFLSNLQLALTR